MKCKSCNIEKESYKCSNCGNIAEEEIATEIYWCAECKVPIIKNVDDIEKNVCPSCNNETEYMCADLRPVFPEERLLFEIIKGEPLKYSNKTVWASNNRYYIDGKPLVLSKKDYERHSSQKIREELIKYKKENLYNYFNEYINRFTETNIGRIYYLRDEADTFINSASKAYSDEQIVVSFSGGKDSTVTADLVTKSLSNPSLVHIFGDTTLEFPLTHEYVKRFRKNNPMSIFKTAINKDQDFYKVCEDIGPPARMLRWCCSMFKTGPITRVINSMYKDQDILTFYGIRKCESANRSRYNRIENNAEAIKIHKQKVASPIFFWKDLDIWLYILSEEIDFNYAYRLGYDRVGCWCCPNNSYRSQFLSSIYMPEEYGNWRSFLISFAKKIGKPDPENYVDSGSWKARQGGNGVESASDVKIKYTNCTAEDNAKVYQLFKPYDNNLIEYFIPFGKISPELGRKIINEVIIVDIKTNIPILSIQPFNQEGYEYAVKIKTMNIAKHDDMQRMVGYQIKKFNACRNCMKCESLCKSGAISVDDGIYHINDEKCTRCRMCVTAKYLEGGCMMEKYLKTKV